MPASWAIDVILYGSPRSGSLDACLKRVLEKKGCPILLGHPFVVGLVETVGMGRALVALPPVASPTGTGLSTWPPRRAWHRQWSDQSRG